MAVAVAGPGAVELVNKDELELMELGMERYTLDYASFMMFMAEVLAVLSFSVGISTMKFDRLLLSGGGVDGDISEPEQSLSGMAGDDTVPQVPGRKMKASGSIYQCETVGDAQYDDDDEDEEEDGEEGTQGGGEEEGGNAEEAEGVEDVGGDEENEEEEDGAEEQGEEEEGGEEDEDDGDEPYEEEEDEDEEEEEENEEDEEPPKKRKK